MKLLFVFLLFFIKCFASHKACIADTDSARIKYTLWMNDNIDTVYSISITAPVNTTFYKVMEIAAKKDPKYEFKAISYDFGHYITEIGGVHEDKNKDIYWMIYQTPQKPIPSHPPSDEYLAKFGVDGLYIQNGEHYLFWYKKVDIHH